MRHSRTNRDARRPCTGKTRKVRFPTRLRHLSARRWMTSLGHDRKTTTATTNGRSGLGNRSFEAGRADGEVAPIPVVHLTSTNAGRLDLGGVSARFKQRQELRAEWPKRAANTIARHYLDRGRPESSDVHRLHTKFTAAQPHQDIG